MNNGYFPTFEEVGEYVKSTPNQTKYFVHQKNKYIPPLFIDIEIYKVKFFFSLFSLCCLFYWDFDRKG